MKKCKISIKPIVIVSAAVILTIVAIVGIVHLTIRSDKKSREYSGEEANLSLRLCYDVDVLGEFEVVETREKLNGIYSEHLIAQEAVDLRMWRDFTRPKMSCRKQALEHYPNLKSYSKQKVEGNEIVSEMGTFIVKADDKTYKHMVVLLRREGWDYLVDFAVEKDKFSEFEDYINSLVDSLFYI